MSVIFFDQLGGPVIPPPDPVPPPPENPTQSDFTDILQDFIDGEPPGLLPIDDGSYWGKLRTCFAVELGIPYSQMKLMYQNMTVATADTYLGDWETEVGLPANPTGKTLEVRRASVLARLRKGPFTRQARNGLIEAFITSTFGPATDFTADGLVLDASGITLYSGINSLDGSFKVYENVKNFSYVVRTNSAMSVDSTLTRELEAYTPAGISVTLSSVAQVLDYAAMMLNSNPTWWSRLGADANDASGYANNGSFVGTTSSVASPGLLNAAVAGGNGARTFNGGHALIPNSTLLSHIGPVLSAKMIFKPTTVDATTRYLWSRAGSFHITTDNVNKLKLINDATSEVVASVSGAFTANTTYDIAVTYHYGEPHFYIDGLEVPYVAGPGIASIIPVNTTGIYFGRKYDSTVGIVGDADEPAIYDYELTADQVWEMFNTKNAVFV